MIAEFQKDGIKDGLWIFYDKNGHKNEGYTYKDDGYVYTGWKEL